MGLEAGKLRERITLISPPQAISDGRAGFTDGPTTQQTRWARVEPLKTGELLALGQQLNTAGYRITVRARPAITAKQRVLWQGKSLNIQGITPSENRDYVLLTCFTSGK